MGLPECVPSFLLDLPETLCAMETRVCNLKSLNATDPIAVGVTWYVLLHPIAETTAFACRLHYGLSHAARAVLAG